MDTFRKPFPILLASDGTWKLKSEKDFFVDQDKYNEPPKRIGIVGAGPCGLYLAYLLTEMRIDYVIYESNDRVGGRIFTHTFPNLDEGSDITPSPENGHHSVGDAGESLDVAHQYAYVEMGPMRFPNIVDMKPLFHLFDRLKLQLLPYRHFEEDNAIMYFNGYRIRKGEGIDSDPFHYFTDDQRRPLPPEDSGISLQDGQILSKEGDVIYSLEGGYSDHLDQLIDQGIDKVRQIIGRGDRITEDNTTRLQDMDLQSMRQYLFSKGYPSALVSFIPFPFPLIH